ncbi:MAG: DNA gyrase subunit A [Candidatus Omnitrophica bacterium]|nr:DNA gyrase subunit A [Candidatus Omnitrophota bacterium]
MSDNIYTKNERIIPVQIEDEMRDSYLSYAMSVIISRALPDVRDGLKPSQRRILIAMNDLGLAPNRGYRKCAKICGDTSGNYHPHGEQVIYPTLVRMAQDFSMRYMLVNGQGNFGSIDGDPPAAMRYTEARLAHPSMELLEDLEKDTVDFQPNYDQTREEPTVLPAKFPNLLVNGADGIAVGMATNIPPHNLKEIAEGIIKLIDDPDVEIKDLLKIVTGPDFPTGGAIAGREGIKNAYLTGRGLIKVQAKANLETQKSGREFIIITEIPYQVNKTNLIENIARLVQEKKLDGVSDLRDESDKDGIRVVIELKRDAIARVTLNQLMKRTQLETTFGIIMLALVDGKPRVLNLKQALECYINHRKEIIIRRTKYELNKAQARAHILEGLKIALDNIDRIVKTIKQSKSTDEARAKLIKDFNLSHEQAQAILEMQLQRLTGLERHKIEEEYLDLIKKIALYKSILASEKKVLAIVREDIAALAEKYGDERRTEIVAASEDLELEDFIAEEDMVITISHTGYIKRIPVTSYRKQRRGGKGVTATELKEEDFVEHLFIATTHEYILFFTDKGRVYWIKVHELPEASRTAKGKPVVNLLSISSGENITAMLPVKEFSEDKYILMTTCAGFVKKTNLSAFSHPRRDGIQAIGLRPNDKLIKCELTDGKSEIILASRHGKAIRFKESQARPMGRTASGVRGINLSSKDYVIGMELIKPDATILTVTEKGFGKRTGIDEYRVQSRGGKGIINIKTTERNGEVVAIKVVTDEDELMMITLEGMMVRCPIREIRSIGRSTQGVKVISLSGKDKLVQVARLAAKSEGEEEPVQET